MFEGRTAVLLKKQPAVLSGIQSGRAAWVTECQFLIKATLSEATSPFNAQLNDSNPEWQSAYHSLLCRGGPGVERIWPRRPGGDSPGAADSAEDGYTQKSRLISSRHRRALFKSFPR